MRTFRYVLTTGWWCGPEDTSNTTRVKFGDESIRGTEFFKKWYHAVDRFTDPVKILVVDSASHCVPDLPDDPRLEWIRLDSNAGHASKHIGTFSGFTRGAICGMTYASLCEVDYWVYLEQDALVYGDGIIEAAIGSMKNDFMFGNGRGTPQPLQQSFMIVKTAAVPAFVERLSSIRYPDSEIAPEIKFWMATTMVSRFFPQKSFREKAGPIGSRIRARLPRWFRGFDVLPFGYGRERPICFSDPWLYLQHASTRELADYERLVSAGSDINEAT